VDAPRDFLCAISRRLLREPLRSPYGHAFEAKVIRAWFAKNGSVCPLTGQPLVESELEADEALKTRVTNWEVSRAVEHNALASSAARGPGAAAANNDDLYDF